MDGGLACHRDVGAGPQAPSVRVPSPTIHTDNQPSSPFSLTSLVARILALPAKPCGEGLRRSRHGCVQPWLEGNMNHSAASCPTRPTRRLSVGGVDSERSDCGCNLGAVGSSVPPTFSWVWVLLAVVVALSRASQVPPHFHPMTCQPSSCPVTARHQTRYPTGSPTAASLPEARRQSSGGVRNTPSPSSLGGGGDIRSPCSRAHPG